MEPFCGSVNTPEQCNSQSYPGRADLLTCVHVAGTRWLTAFEDKSVVKTNAIGTDFSYFAKPPSTRTILSSMVNGVFWSIGFQTSLSL